MFARLASRGVARGMRAFSSASSSDKSFVSTPLKTVLQKYLSTAVSTLQNGVRVASEPHASPTATIAVFVETGSVYETEQNNGVAHFAEHLFFKGTQKRSRIALEQEIENMGGHLNAYTSREETVFQAQVPKEKAAQAMDILSDVVLNSKISAEAVEAERSVILREEEDILSRQQEVVYDYLHYTAYRGTPLSRPILGPAENIRKISKEDIDTYIKTNFVAPRMVVAGAGVPHEELVKLAEKHLSAVPTVAPSGLIAVKQPSSFTGSDIRVRNDEDEAAHIAYAFETAGHNDPDHVPLMVLQMLIGSWNDNLSVTAANPFPLMEAIADGHLAKSITPFNTVYSSTGLFGVYAVADALKLNALMGKVSTYFTSLSNNLREDAVEAAKERLKVQLLRPLGDSATLCEEIGRQMLNHGRRIHPLEMIKRIDAVDSIALQQTASRFFYDRDYALAATGPLYELPDYNYMRRRTFSLIN